jgi:TatD DNase family protein
MADAAAPAVYCDTHAHLADPALSGEADAAIQRALEAGVRRVVAVGYDLATSEASLALARRDGVWAAVGIHPNSASDADPASLARIGELARDPRVVAIGETGLDYYRDRVPPDVQRRAFEAHLAIADAVDKPVIVHDREAHGEVLRILLEWARARRLHGKRSVPGVLHCFSGDLGMAEAAIDAGFVISFAGNLTYRSAAGLAEVSRQVDLDAVVVETDCPYLAPAPRRGERNGPRNVALVAERLADLRGLPVVEVARRTTANALRLFGLDAPTHARPTADRTS